MLLVWSRVFGGRSEQLFHDDRARLFVGDGRRPLVNNDRQHFDGQEMLLDNDRSLVDYCRALLVEDEGRVLDSRGRPLGHDRRRRLLGGVRHVDSKRTRLFEDDGRLV